MRGGKRWTFFLAVGLLLLPGCDQFELVDESKAVAPRLGQPLAISGTTVDGQKFDLTELRGKVVLIDFWTTWCGPCRERLPHIQELYKRYHSEGFEVVSISLDDDRGELNAFLKEEKPTWITLYDGPWADSLNASHYGINAVPTMYLVDRQGNLALDDPGDAALDEGLKKLLSANIAARETRNSR